MSVTLPVRDVYLRESGGKFLVTNEKGIVTDDPIVLVPGDLVEVEAVPMQGFDPTAEIVLARWKMTWEWTKSSWFGIKKDKKVQPMTVPKSGRLGSQLAVKLVIPGVAQQFTLAPTLAKQFAGRALRADTLKIIGLVGDITVRPNEHKPNKDANLTHGPDREPNVGIENKIVFHLRIFITRAATTN